MGICWSSRAPKPTTAPSDLSKGTNMTLLSYFTELRSGLNCNGIDFVKLGYRFIIKISVKLSHGRKEFIVSIDESV